MCLVPSISTWIFNNVNFAARRQNVWTAGRKHTVLIPCNTPADRCNLKEVQFQAFFFLRHWMSQRIWFIFPTYKSALTKRMMLQSHQFPLYRIHYRPFISKICSMKSVLLNSKSDLCLLSSSYKYLYDHEFLSLNW